MLPWKTVITRLGGKDGRSAKQSRFTASPPWAAAASRVCVDMCHHNAGPRRPRLDSRRPLRVAPPMPQSIPSTYTFTLSLSLSLETLTPVTTPRDGEGSIIHIKAERCCRAPSCPAMWVGGHTRYTHKSIKRDNGIRFFFCSNVQYLFEGFLRYFSGMTLIMKHKYWRTNRVPGASHAAEWKWP